MFKDHIETVALFGGSFDPPHFGHKSVVEEALKCLKIEKLIVVPTFLNPFKKTSYFTIEKRFELTQKIFSEFSNVLVDDYEIKQNKSVFTVETVRYFQKSYNVKYLIIGADNLENIEKWHHFEWLNKRVTWVIAKRRGYEIKIDKLSTYRLLEIDVDISSTQIRKKIKENS